MDNGEPIEQVVHCPHCRAGYALHPDTLPPSGITYRCRECGRDFPVMHPDGYYFRRFSIEIAQYFIRRKQVQDIRGLKFNLGLLLAFQRFLAKRDKHLRFASLEDIREFSKKVAERISPQKTLFVLKAFYDDLAACGMVMDNPIGQEEGRHYPRGVFIAKAVLHLGQGSRILGETRDVSFQGARFRAFDGLMPAQVGDLCFLQIFFDKTIRRRQSFVALPCRVARVEEGAVGLELVDYRQVIDGGVVIPFNPNLWVQRSSGELEGGWSHLLVDNALPDHIKRQVEGLSHLGPVVVCLKRERGEEQVKVYPLRELQRIQDLVREE